MTPTRISVPAGATAVVVDFETLPSSPPPPSRKSACVLSQDETKGDGAAPSRYPKPRQDK